MVSGGEALGGFQPFSNGCSHASTKIRWLLINNSTNPGYLRTIQALDKTSIFSFFALDMWISVCGLGDHSNSIGWIQQKQIASQHV